jgi:hypothetical protein
LHDDDDDDHEDSLVEEVEGDLEVVNLEEEGVDSGTEGVDSGTDEEEMDPLRELEEQIVWQAQAVCAHRKMRRAFASWRTIWFAGVICEERVRMQLTWRKHTRVWNAWRSYTEYMRSEATLAAEADRCRRQDHLASIAERSHHARLARTALRTWQQQVNKQNA